MKFTDVNPFNTNIQKKINKNILNTVKKGDFISYEPNSIHSSFTKKGCLVLTFMRGPNYQIKEK